MGLIFDILNDNTEEVMRELEKKIPAALEECGLVAEGFAKRLSPVDTGTLRNSITHTTSGETEYIGTNVEYAPYVEMGTSRTRAQPFLQPAIENNTSTYKGIIEKHLSS